MIDKLDLTRRMKREEYREAMAELEVRLPALQREAWQMGIPVLLVFEGWEASGKGTVIGNLIRPLDPRGFKVTSIRPPNEEEAMRPFLWRFWCLTPAAGRLAILVRSWYRRVLAERVHGPDDPLGIEQAFSDILAFEDELAAGGTLIVKMFLHISRDEQKRRFRKLEKDPATAWRVTAEDRAENKAYKAHVAAVEEMLVRTDRDTARWTVVEAHDERYATVRVYQTVIAALETAIRGRRQRAATAPRKARRAAVSRPHVPSTLDRVDISLTLSREEYDKRLPKAQKRLRHLEHEMYRRRLPAVLLYEGWDAAGKGGNIRRLTRELDPRGYEVVPISAPNDIERAHHYLWRFWTRVPKAGHLTIFDRSWYGRVLVERIEGFCSEAEWERAYAEINAMEQHLANAGVVLVKFWLDIDAGEQLRRFQSRQDDETRSWKITPEDWRNREKWDAYRTAVDEMLFRTSTPYAPWTVVEANCKLHARVKAIETVIAAIEAAMAER